MGETRGGAPYRLVVLFCSIIGLVVLLAGIVLRNVYAIIGGAAWMVVPVSAYLILKTMRSALSRYYLM